MNATPLTAGRTVSAGNDKERQDPNPNTVGLGQAWGNPIRTGQLRECVGEQQLKPHSNTDMDPTQGSDSTEIAG